MDIRNKRFVETVYKIEGEETNRIFVYEIDPNPVNMTHLSFTQLVENFDRLEGTDYAENIKIIREEIIESKFVDDPKVTRSFEVEVPVSGMYTRQVDVRMSKYTADRHQLDDVKYQAVYGAKVDVEHDSLDMDKVYAMRVVDDVPNRVIISGEFPIEDEPVAEEEE
jgi:hypothetical protein